MVSKTFVNQSVPVVDADWLNDANAVVYAGLAAPGGAPFAATAQYLAAADATSRSIQVRLRETQSLKDYGAVGDGVTDDTVAIQKWLNSGLHLYAPAGVYKHTAKLQTVGGSLIFGAGPHQTIFKKFFDGDQFDWADSVALVDIEWDGNGGTYTGSNATISSGSRQMMFRCRFIDAASNPIVFSAANMGTQFSFISSQIRSTTSTMLTTGALLFHPGDTSTNTKGCMTNIDCEGGVLFDTSTGAVGGLKAVSCTCQGVIFNNNNVNVSLVGCRLATYDVHIKGIAVQVSGCAIAGDLYLDASCSTCVIGPNVMAAGKFLINNATGQNEIYGQQVYSWTPTLSLVNSLGNGVLSGKYARNGNVITATISFVAGSTTTFNSGAIACSLPRTPVGGLYQVGTVHALDSGTNFRTGVWKASDSTATSDFTSDQSGTSWSHAVPFTWAAGDEIHATISYLAL